MKRACFNTDITAGIFLALAMAAFLGISPDTSGRTRSVRPQEPSDVFSSHIAEQAGSSAGYTYTAAQEFFFDIIRNRRTVRKFRDTPVPKDHILKILDMARCAPTSGNQQPWKFLVIQDRAKLDLLKGEALGWYLSDYEKKFKPAADQLKSVREKLAATMENVLAAPVYVAVLTDTQSTYASYNIHDGPLAAGTLMLAARALGYGTGYYTTYFPEARMRAFFGIPARYNLVCFTPIGIPAEWPASPQKKSLEELVVFEKF